MKRNGFKMNKQTEDKCKKLIHKYFLYKADYKKREVRNNLYLLMKGDIIMWIKNILKKWGKYIDDTEVISLSWDCFEFCLARYDLNREGSLCKFFFDASRYCLLMEYAKKDKVRLKPEELQEILRIENTPLNNIFDNLLTLTQFRDNLTRNEEKIVWDDACISLSSSHMDRKERPKKSGMSTAEYGRLKRIFINQIKMILNIRI